MNDDTTKKQIQLQKKILGGPKNNMQTLNSKLKGRLAGISSNSTGATTLPKMPRSTKTTIENRFDSKEDAMKDKPKTGPNQAK